MANYNYKADENGHCDVPYSLPRLITPAVQCSFCTYFWELYTTEFGWTKAEYGVVSWTCTGTQFFSFILLGVVFNFAIETITGQPDAQNKIGANAVKNGKKLKYTIQIEIAVTYFFLIILPIKWHGVKTPYVDSLFGKTSKFRQAMLNGPIALSSMASHKHWYRFMHILWPFVKLIWIPLYPFMKGFYLCIPMSHRKKNVVNITQIPGTPVDVGDIPDLGAFVDRSKLPLLSTLESITLAKTNNFAMRMNHARQFMGTRTFLIYILTVAHGIGVSAHELCNKASLTYIYPEKQKNTTGQTQIAPSVNKNNSEIDVNFDKRNNLGVFNLAFFFVAQLLIIFLFSLIKFFAHSGSIFSETFYLISILFFIFHIPLLPPFYVKTTYAFNKAMDKTYGSQDPETKDLNPVPTSVKQPWLKVVCLTIFHGTILFWMFSGGPLTFYVSAFILNWDTGIMSFGVLINNIALCGTSWLFTILANQGLFGNPFGDNKPKIVMGICIVAELLHFLLFFKHDWWWNKGNWFHYVLFILCGGVNSIFVAYVNVMLDNAVKTTEQQIKQNKWIAIGGFFAFTNAIISIGFFFMFKSLGRDEIINCGCKCFRFNYHYYFPTVYMTITFILTLMNGLSLLAYCLSDK